MTEIRIGVGALLIASLFLGGVLFGAGDGWRPALVPAFVWLGEASRPGPGAAAAASEASTEPAPVNLKVFRVLRAVQCEPECDASIRSSPSATFGSLSGVALHLIKADARGPRGVGLRFLPGPDAASVPATGVTAAGTTSGTTPDAGTPDNTSPATPAPAPASAILPPAPAPSAPTTTGQESQAAQEDRSAPAATGDPYYSGDEYYHRDDRSGPGGGGLGGDGSGSDRSGRGSDSDGKGGRK